MTSEDPSPTDDKAGATVPDGPAAPDMTTPTPGMAITNVPVPGMQTTRVPGMTTTQLATGDGEPHSRSHGASDVRAMALTPGTEIDGKYRLETMLGRGGMGIVWRAVHSHLQGSVAIKFLLDRFRGKPQIIERFWQEAKLMGDLGHPNIVRVLDISPASNDLPYITMELLTQGSLRDHLKKSGGRVPVDEAVELLDGVLSALIAAHKRGIVHRDIKPDNLMLANIRNIETDTFEIGVKILDFGASLLLSDNLEQNAAEGLLGTPYYMSPEQASGLPLDQRTDLYSTAVVLYELISGKLPHTADDVHTLIYNIATEPARPIAEQLPNITRPYREFFTRALAMDPGARFQTADEMRQEMRKLSRRLAGKVRNTALYLAPDAPTVTGPHPTLPAAGQTTGPLEPFRKVLDSQIQRIPLPQRPPEPPPPPPRVRPAAIAVGAAAGAAVGAIGGTLTGATPTASALAGLSLAVLAAGLTWWSAPR